MQTLLLCLVIGISDGDTLKARCDLPTGAVNVTVRLAEIDAPEKAQPWGNRSKQHLAALCFQKSARISQQTTDRYGRSVARVTCDGRDANAEQVRAGLAWVFDRYVIDRGLYAVQDDVDRLFVALARHAEEGEQPISASDRAVV